MSEFKIRRAENGIILTDEDDGEIVFQIGDKECGEVIEDFAEFLRFIKDNYNPDSDSRYAKKRIHIIVAPGDKSKEYEEMTVCPFCFQDF